MDDSVQTAGSGGYVTPTGGTLRHLVLAMLWGGVAIASVLGLSAAFGRAVAVIASTRDSGEAIVSGYDRMALEITTGLLGIPPGSERYREHETDVAEFSRKYFVHSVPTLLHVIPGALLFVLVPLQFSSWIRTRHRRFHRWSGRIVLASVVPIGLSAFFFGAMPFGGISESLAAVVFGGVFFYAGGRALLAIRRGDVVHHREWMIRMFAVAVGVSTIRVVELILVTVTEARPQVTFGPSLWLGWCLTLGFAEAWIRYTRSDVPPDRVVQHHAA